MKKQIVANYGYDNFRYDLFGFWHFCNEIGPATTWQQAWREYLLEENKKASAAELWFKALPLAERKQVRARFTADVLAAEQNGVKYRAPKGHGAAVLAAQGW